VTAPNHALTGAVIGLSVGNPLLAGVLAFASHFVCDMIPHYDMAEPDMARRYDSRQFMVTYLLIPALICLLIVIILAMARPQHWLAAAVCAFLAASPDLFWIPRYIHAKRTKTDPPLRNRFLRFHEGIQWLTGPRLIWVEAIWFIVFGAILLRNI
jgi:hypothetical protein